MEAEVASLHDSITTAHQDMAKAQAEMASLQRSITTARRDQADAKAALHKYAAAHVPLITKFSQNDRMHSSLAATVYCNLRLSACFT